MTWLAFSMGLAGSLHCVLMCGALFSIALHKKSNLHTLVYWLGKVAVYIAFGTVLGYFGELFFIQKFQHYAAITAGVLLIVFTWFVRLSFFGKWVTALSSRLFQASSPSLFSTFVKGIGNGFVPCHLVYMAALVAAVQPSMSEAAYFMAWFGIGTAPAVFISPLLWQKLKLLPISFSLLQKILLTLIATTLILRGVWQEIKKPTSQSEEICLIFLAN